MRAISVATLAACFTQPHPPMLVDVRRLGARTASGLGMENAIWRDPAAWLDWKDEVAALPGPLVVCCAHGHEISQAMTAALCALGKDAQYLEGGFEAWRQAGLPVVDIASGGKA